MQQISNVNSPGELQL